MTMLGSVTSELLRLLVIPLFSPVSPFQLTQAAFHIIVSANNSEQCLRTSEEIRQTLFGGVAQARINLCG